MSFGELTALLLGLLLLALLVPTAPVRVLAFILFLLLG